MRQIHRGLDAVCPTINSQFIKNKKPKGLECLGPFWLFL
nr:hypothetical protein [Sediminibacillus halophilus]